LARDPLTGLVAFSRALSLFRADAIGDGLRWLHVAADAGVAPAATLLGQLLYGFAPETSVQYLKAAEAEDPRATYLLGVIAFRGRPGSPKCRSWGSEPLFAPEEQPGPARCSGNSRAMPLPSQFKLERYFARYDFTVRHLSSSGSALNNANSPARSYAGGFERRVSARRLRRPVQAARDSARFASMMGSFRQLALLSVVALAPACGDDGGSPPPPVVQDLSVGEPSDAAIGVADLLTLPDLTPAGPLRLESSAIMPGAAIASRFTCAGINVSPPLAFAGGPPAKSYALILQDLSNKNIHWVIWDIPPSTVELSENVAKQAMPAVPAGAKQTFSYDGSTYGYLGPCPGGNVHTYEFAVYALDVATLPNVKPTTPRATVADAIRTQATASATLQGTSDAKKP
jgi:Raf kinase inhibitor-like YbhB/YbcL family protein